MKIKSKRELLVKSFVQYVSSPTTHSKRYKKVCKLLDSRPVLTEDQWFGIWRGLYYTIWYTEMGKGCEELATKIGTNEDLTMILIGFKSLTNDWFGIDNFRVDKYMFLVRIMINNCLKLQLNALSHKQSIGESLDTTNTQLSTDKANDNVVESEVKVDNEDNESNNKSVSEEDNKKSAKYKNKKFNKRKSSTKEIKFPIEIKAELIDSILTIVKSSIGLTLHINDLFIDELIKAMNELKPNWKSDEKIDAYFNILLPFVKLMALSDDNRVRDSVKQNIFIKLKNEVIVSESIDFRKQILQKFVEGMLSIGGVEEIGRKNRDLIYNILEVFKSKLTLLSSSNENKSVKKRKIVTKSGNRKKVKYELTSASPFVRSIVPIPVI